MLVAALPLLLLSPLQREQVGPDLMSTYQRLRPYGQITRMDARPLNIARLPDGQLVAKAHNSIQVIDPSSNRVVTKFTVSGSMTGLLVRGDRIYTTDAGSQLHELAFDGKTLTRIKVHELPKPSFGGASFGNGIAGVSSDKLVVALSRANSLALVDLSGAPTKTIATDPAPMAVKVLGDGRTAVVACWSRLPKGKEPTAESAGTQVPVDTRGIGKEGSVNIVDLETGKVTARIPVGLQPNDIEIVGNLAFVACANDDSIAVIDLQKKAKRNSIVVKPDMALPFGSAPTAVRASRDAQRLLVTCGGNNAVAVIKLATGKVEKWIPTEWYPTDIERDGDHWYVANAKGIGSRVPQKDGNFGVYGFTGSVTRFPLNVESVPASASRFVMESSLGNAIRSLTTPSTAKGVKPVALPKKVGEPSTIDHVVYILKENRTYDQVFGDLKQGDGDPSLAIYPRKVTPNHHALAERYVLLDNYYCNGVLSADGHSWAMEGYVTSHFERSFGGFSRSYTFGDDPLAFSSSGFIWDQVLGAGKSFRNYGEFDYAEPEPKSRTFTQIYNDFVSGKPQKFSRKVGVERVRRYSNQDYPGWNMRIPDVLRASVFLKELKQFEKKGYFPNLTVIYLPQDHASGTSPGLPTTRAHVADNDLALGQIVEGLSKSKFWKKMAIFVNEDDPQDGFDHVDGHRSLCLVISPYAQRQKVVSNFYNQNSVRHTMLRMLGLPPVNQMDARGPLMSACFTDKPDFRPYTALKNQIPLNEMNPPLRTLKGKAREYALLSLTIPDEWSGKRTQAHDRLLNRINWYSVKGNAPYPAHLEGAHGKGLAGKGLKADPEAEEEDEDEDDD